MLSQLRYGFDHPGSEHRALYSSQNDELCPKKNATEVAAALQAPHIADSVAAEQPLQESAAI